MLTFSVFFFQFVYREIIDGFQKSVDRMKKDNIYFCVRFQNALTSGCFCLESLNIVWQGVLFLVQRVVHSGLQTNFIV